MPKRTPTSQTADDPWGSPEGPSPDDAGMGAHSTDDGPPWDPDGTEDSGGAPKDTESGLDEFKPKTTSDPVNPRRATANRRKTKAEAPPGDGAVGADDPDPDEQRLAALESGEQELQFHSLDDLTEYLKVMYYGQEGTRKTTNALRMTQAGEGRVLLVNAEGGAKRTPLRKHGVDTSRVVVWPPEGERVSFAGLEKLFYRIRNDLMDDPGSWLGTVWDSATDIHQALLDQVVEADIARQTEIIAKNKGRRPGNVVLRDRFDTDRDDYKLMSNQFRLLLRRYRDLSCHFVVTALMRTDEVARKSVQGPAVTPAIGTDLMGYMDIVLLTRVARFGEAHVGFAQTAPDDTHRAKDRFDVLPVELPNPSFDRLVSYVAGDLTPENDPDLELLAPSGAGRTTMKDGPTDAAAKAEVVRARAAVKDDVAAHEPATAATKTQAARRRSGKKPDPAPAVPSSTPDDQPPY